jgi:hypothetical protein
MGSACQKRGFGWPGDRTGVQGPLWFTFVIVNVIVNVIANTPVASIPFPSANSGDLQRLEADPPRFRLICTFSVAYN